MWYAHRYLYEAQTTQHRAENTRWLSCIIYSYTVIENSNYWGQKSGTTWLDLLDLSCHLIDWLYDFISILKCILVSTWRLRFNWPLPKHQTRWSKTCLSNCTPRLLSVHLFFFSISLHVVSFFLGYQSLALAIGTSVISFLSVFFFFVCDVCVCVRETERERDVLFMPSLFPQWNVQ